MYQEMDQTHLNGTLDIVNIQEDLCSASNGKLCLQNFLNDPTTGEHLTVDFENKEVFFRGSNVAHS